MHFELKAKIMNVFLMRLILLLLLSILLIGCESNRQVQYVPLEAFGESELDTKIPKLELYDKSVQESLAELVKQWKEQSPDELLPKIIVLGTPGKHHTVSLVLDDKSVKDCLRYICMSSGMKYFIYEGNIIIRAQKRIITEDWSTEVYKLSLIQKRRIGIYAKFDVEQIIDFFGKYGVKINKVSRIGDSWGNGNDLMIIDADNNDHKRIKMLLMFIEKGKIIKYSNEK